MMTETMAEDGEGYDPDTFTDCGVIQTLTAPTFDALKVKIEKSWKMHSSNSELPQVFENTIEWDCEGEHSYNTPKEEQIPFREIYQLHITKVEETPVDESVLEDLIKA